MVMAAKLLSIKVKRLCHMNIRSVWCLLLLIERKAWLSHWVSIFILFEEIYQLPRVISQCYDTVMVFSNIIRQVYDSAQRENQTYDFAFLMSFVFYRMKKHRTSRILMSIDNSFLTSGWRADHFSELDDTSFTRHNMINWRDHLATERWQMRWRSTKHDRVSRSLWNTVKMFHRY